MGAPFGIDGTPTVWTRSDGVHVYPADAYRNGGEHLNNLPWDHGYIHEGERFFSSYRDLSVTNGATVDLVAEVGANLNPHLEVTVAVGGDFTVDLYRGVTAAANGTLLAARNRNQEVELVAGVTPEVAIRIDPTISDLGTLLDDGGLLLGGSGGKAAGGVSSNREELIWPRATKHLYRFTNVSGQTRVFAVRADWYEHEPVGTGVT